jgi:hypothetical protein
LNLRPQREQTSWSQTLTTGPPPRWLVQNPSCLCLSLHSQLCVDLPNQNEKSYMIKRVCFREYEGVAYFSWY